MFLFDANVRVGRFNGWSGSEPITTRALLSIMDHCGIHEALLVGSLSFGCHPADGNRRILDVTADEPRLHPAWALLPPAGRETLPPAEAVAQMADRGVRAVFIYPRQYYFSLDEWCVDALLEPLAARHVPLFICADRQNVGQPGRGAWRTQDNTDWSGVVRICRAFPELPVVVVEQRISYSMRPMYQALDACPNLHLDLSTLWLHHVIEFICREWGAERLLFGSGLPRRDPGAVLGQLIFSDITQDELAEISGGNLRRLLSWNGPLPAPVDVDFPEPIDELHAIPWSLGSLRGQGFHSAHGHLGRGNLQQVPDLALSDIIAEMERLGVESEILFTNGGLASDETWGNDLVIAAVRQYPERFTGFVSVNVHRSDDEIRREIDRGFAMGMQGIKIHPDFQGYDTRGPKVDMVCAIADERHTFIVSHNWGDSDRLASLCREYPNACFVTGHTSPAAIPVTKLVDNLYIGTCPLNGWGVTEHFVRGAGADRLVFGSDLLWNPVAWGIGPILYARIPVEDKRKILGGNIRRLLARYNR